MLVLIDYKNSTTKENACSANYTGLLSPKIYAGIIKPKNFIVLNYEPLQTGLEKYITENNVYASVYIQNFRNGASMGIREDKGYLPASLNKIPLAILIMKKVENGELNMDALITINNSDRSATWGDLYKGDSKRLPLRILLEKMLKESDNTAFFTLHRLVNPGEVTFLFNYLNYFTEGKTANKSVSDEELLLTPKSVYNLYSSLYYSNVLEPSDSEYILSLLTNTSFNIKKIAELPANVTVAQKFGAEYDADKKYFHNCGIIYSGDTRIFYCVMTQGLSEKQAINLVGFVVNQIYYYIIYGSEQYKLYSQIEFSKNNP